MSNSAAAQFFWDDEVAPKPARGADCIWHGLLASGVTTLLGGHGKPGKTTLLSTLLSRLGGSGWLADLGVTPGKTVVVS